MSFFWGGGPLSWMRYMTLWSFRLQNPGWDIHLYLAPTCQNKATWTSNEQQDCSPPMTCRDHLPELAACGVKVEQWIPPADFATMSPVHMADLCRWGVLSKFGGWFADTDILWVDSMKRVQDRYDSDAKNHEARRGPGSFKAADVALPLCRDWLPTGLIGAVPDNRFSADLYMMARNSADPRGYQSAGRSLILKVCGLDPVFPADKREVVRGLTTGFPGVVFWLMHHLTCYQWEWFDAHVIFDQDKEVLLETVGIHWYAGSRVGQKFNRLLDGHNFRGYKNTFCHYAANLLDGKFE
jgi:hypothetical protein